MDTWRYRSDRLGRRPGPRGPGPLLTNIKHRTPSCSRIIKLIILKNRTRKKNTAPHTGLEGPSCVSFNRIFVFALAGRIIFDIIIMINICIQINRDRRDDNTNGVVIRVIHGTSRVVNWTVDGRMGSARPAHNDL